MQVHLQLVLVSPGRQSQLIPVEKAVEFRSDRFRLQSTAATGQPGTTMPGYETPVNAVPAALTRMRTVKRHEFARRSSDTQNTAFRN